MHDFRKLEVWNRSKKFVKVLFEATRAFPKEKIFGPTSQMKRAAISIPSNIAEGCGRGTNKQLAYHLDVALGSAFELETQIGVAGDLNYLNSEKETDLTTEKKEIEKMLIDFKRVLIQRSLNT